MKKLICLMFILIGVFSFGVNAQAADYVYSASAQGELSLHISPDEESYRITSVPACSKLKLIRTERTWGLVEFRNKCGWINLSFTRDTYDHAAEATGNDSVKNVKVSSEEEKTALYNVPSTSGVLGSEEKYTVPNGMILKITRETASGWGLASMNDKYAWVQLENTQPYETDAEKDVSEYGIYYVYVLSDEGKGLELLSEPGTGSLCAVIPDCIKLTVRETKDSYAYVSYDGINGWIDLRYTAQSLSNAQSGAGVAVNVEYEITPPEGSEAVDMLSVPSDNPNDGASVVGSIEGGTAVFVQRSTLNGWNLVNYDGVLGWIAPGSAVPSQMQQVNMIEPLKKKETGYVATVENKGIKIYSTPDDDTAVATIPECTKVDIIARNEGYDYVYCDYAAGWTLSGQTAATYAEAIERYPLDSAQRYVLKAEANLMSIPTNSELCASELLATVGENTYFTVTKIAVTAKRKWGLTEIDGKTGWINLGYAEKTLSQAVLVLIYAGVVILVAAAVALIVIFIRRKKAVKRG